MQSIQSAELMRARLWTFLAATLSFVMCGTVLHDLLIHFSHYATTQPPHGIEPNIIMYQPLDPLYDWAGVAHAIVSPVSRLTGSLGTAGYVLTGLSMFWPLLLPNRLIRCGWIVSVGLLWLLTLVEACHRQTCKAVPLFFLPLETYTAIGFFLLLLGPVPPRYGWLVGVSLGLLPYPVIALLSLLCPQLVNPFVVA
jgi:hypothetical protein